MHMLVYVGRRNGWGAISLSSTSTCAYACAAWQCACACATWQCAIFSYICMTWAHCIATHPDLSIFKHFSGCSGAGAPFPPLHSTVHSLRRKNGVIYAFRTLWADLSVSCSRNTRHVMSLLPLVSNQFPHILQIVSSYSSARGHTAEHE